ncbi:MAG: DNA-directed RNA polymerase subunit beta, partial [Firmicutes bacterium]|nr:DNA-directed RNA polymerase subunit beta [Bacillota bacterium]
MKRERVPFSRIPSVIDLPNLIEIQQKSYRWFLDEGLHEAFRDISPVQDFTGNLVLEFTGYALGEPKYTEAECKRRDASYSAPLNAKVRLISKETGEVKEQEVFMGDFPLMTRTGTFIINGAERVVVSQLVRSPGAYFEADKSSSGKRIYKAAIRPNRGAWLEFETDASDIVWVRVDRTRKLPATVLLRAVGLSSDEEIIDVFGENEYIRNTLERDNTKNEEEALIEIYKRLRPGEPPAIESAKSLFEFLFFDPKRYDLAGVGRYKLNKKLELADRLIGHTLAQPIYEGLGEVADSAGAVVDPETGEVSWPGPTVEPVISAGEKITARRAELVRELEQGGQ